MNKRSKNLLRSGTLFDLANPKAEDVDIRDVAYSLARLERFNGHLYEGDTVARHSLRVMRLVPMEYKLDALLHDAAEAYTGDIVRPVKDLLGDALEKVIEPIEQVVAQAFGLRWPIPEIVKEADRRDCSESIRKNLRKNPGEYLFPEVKSNAVEDQREFLRAYAALEKEREDRSRGRGGSYSPIIYGRGGRT